MVVAVATQRMQFSNYMQTYKIGSSDDGKSWKMYKEGNKDKLFYYLNYLLIYQFNQ